MEINHCLVEQFNTLALLYKNQPTDASAYDTEGNHVLSGELRPVCLTCEFARSCPKTAYNIFKNPYITQSILDTLREEGIVHFERRVTAQGEGEEGRMLHVFFVTLIKAKDHNGELVGYLMTCEDRTEQAKRQNIKEEDLNYIYKSLEMSKIITMRYDIASTLTTTLIDGTYVQLTNEERINCIHPDDREAADQLMQNLITGKTDTEHMPLVRLLPPGADDYRYFKSDISILFNGKGERTTIFANHYDINEEHRKRTEKQKTLAILNMALSKTTLSVWNYEPSTRRYEVYQGNRFVPQKQDILEKLTNVDDKDAEQVRKLVREIIGGKLDKATYSARMRNADGSHSFIEYNIVAIYGEHGKVAHLSGLTMDVTERVKRELGLKEQRFLVELALNSYGVGIWRYDIAAKFFTGVLGKHQVPPGGLTYDRFMSLLLPEAVETIGTLFHELEEGKKTTDNIVVPFVNPRTGEVFYNQNAFAVLHDTEGRVASIVGVAKGVTEELLKQRELQQYKINTGLVNDVSHIVYWNYDLDTQLISAQGKKLHKGGLPLTKAEYMEYVYPADRPKVQALLDALDSRVASYPEIDVRSILPGMEGFRYTAIYVAPVKNNAGDIVGYTGIRRDVTNEKEHQRGLELINSQLSLVLKMSRILPFIWYPERGMFYVQNTEMKRDYDVFEQDATEVSYEHTIANNHPDDRKDVIQLLENVRTGKISNGWCKVRYDAKKHYATTFIVSLFPNPSRQEDEEPSFMGFMHDVTNDEQMMQQLMAAKLKAEESDRLKSAFLANMSHEIRTPLNAIVGFSDLLLITDDPQEREEYSQIITKNNQLLLQLVNDIIELSRMEAGRIDRSPALFNLNELFTISFNMHRAMVKSPEVEVLLDIPKKDYLVNWDKRRTMELLNNFISNADKYTEKGYIKIGFKELEDGMLKIFVEDTGCGISQENQKKVFDRFEKLDSFKQGAGLGMAICQSYVKAAGGKIGVDSEVGKGSTFWVTMRIS